MSNRDSWANEPLSRENNQRFVFTEKLLPISLISTDFLVTCDINDLLKEILEKEQYNDFDRIPVRSQGTIVGLLNRSKLENKDVSKKVSEVMEELKQSILISSNASILSFIETSDNHTCRLVLDGIEIKGIVTISDLQKLEVRIVIFSLITTLELLMAEFIRKSYSDEEWIEKLTEPRRIFVDNKWEYLKKNNMAIDRVSATEFCDKRTILVNSQLFIDRFNPANNSLIKGKPQKSIVNQSEEAFKKIEKLRNSVTHAGDYALSEEKAVVLKKAGS